MKRPRYQTRQLLMDADVHTVIDTNLVDQSHPRTNYSQNYPYAEACALAQWLNERDRGYPTNIKFTDHDIYSQTFAPIRAELHDLKSQSYHNWVEHQLFNRGYRSNEI